MQLIILAFIFLLFHLNINFSSAQAKADYDRGPLQELTQFRQQHRFTVSGQLCAAAFVQNFQTYTDCTDAPNPDGVSGREWCYLEVQLLGKGAKNWGFCSPVIDYNLIRAKANTAFQAKTSEVEKMVERLDAERNRLEDILRRYHTTCGAQHDAVGARLGKIESLIQKADHCVLKIEETTAKITSMRVTIASIQEQIETQKEAADKAPENCATVSGYEDDPFPDGLRGAYYKDPFFKGVPVYRNDENIDFQWTGKEPHPGIPNEGFSIRWDGYVQAPFTGEYIFMLEADCGARAFLNSQPIIVDRMPPPTAKDSFGDHDVPLLPPSEHDGPRMVESAPLVLNGGQKNRIRIEMVHSNHLRWSNPGDSSIKLLWRTPGSKNRVISKDRFFQSNSKSPLKISGLDPNLYEITFLYDGEFAHKGSRTNFLADIPLIYYGAKTIRTTQLPTQNKLQFDVNIPAELYIAAPMGVGNPFSPCEGSLKETLDILSIYAAETRSARATTATHMTIYKTDILKPRPYTVNLLKPNTPFIAFLTPRKDEGDACGGVPILLSKPDSVAYEFCEASSMKAPEFGCQYGLNGRNVDQPTGTWKSKGGNGVGEYIIVRFKAPVQISEFKFKPLDDPITWPSEITLFFSETVEEGNEQVLTILHSNNMDRLTYPINPQVTKYVKILISRMYVNGENTGGSFEIHGTVCREEEQAETAAAVGAAVAPTEATTATTTEATAAKVHPELVTIQDCHQTVDDLSSAHPMETGNKLTVVCPTKCLSPSKPAQSKTPTASFILSKVVIGNNGLPETAVGSDASDSTTTGSSRVYGSQEYSPESEICAASVHAGACTSPSDLPCHVTLTMALGKPLFKGETQHGIKSENHGPSEISIVFSSAVSLPPIEEPKGRVYGISFRAADLGLPPQGYKIDDGAATGSRDVAASLIYGWERQAKLVKCPVRGEGANPLNEGGVEFPPSPSAPVCQSSQMDCRPNTWSITLPTNGPYRLEVQVGNPCEPKEGTRKYFLQANGQAVINGEELAKGQFFWATEDISITNKKLTLTSECNAGQELSEVDTKPKSISSTVTK